MRSIPAILCLAACMGCAVTIGWKFDPDMIRGFQVGQMTIQDARLQLGSPLAFTMDSQGCMTYTWVYFHGTISDLHERIRADLTFGLDGKLTKWTVSKPLKPGVLLLGDPEPEDKRFR